MIPRVFPALLLFVAFSVHAADVPGIIEGRIYDRETGEPLPHATVLYGRNLGTTSGIDGFFLLSIESGHHVLTFRYVGYRTITRAVFVAPGDTVLVEVGLELDAAEIDQVVVSAGKIEQRVSELTVSLHIIKPEVISSSHITDATELLNKTPGIEVMDGQASIRGGSGYSYGAGSRVLALIDGLPVLSADAGNIKWHFLPLENISQVEVIKGASSVLYGSSALNGVINFRTARPGTEPVTRFYIESGIFDRPRNDEWVWWDSPRTYSSTSLSHLQRSGNTDLGASIHIMNDNGYRRLNDERLGRANVLIRHDDLKVDGLSYGTTINAGLTKKRDFILWENAWTGALKQDESAAMQMTGSLVTIDPYITFKGEGGSQHDLRTRFQASDNGFTDAVHNDSRAISLFAEYQYRQKLSDRIDVNAGLLENYSRITSAFYGDHDALNLAGYIQTDLTPVRRLRMVAGLRLEYNSLNGEGDRPVALFRAGINYRVMDYTFLRASFGQGYRYPSIAEKHAATTVGSVRIVPNPGILPESGWSSELGLKQGISTGSILGQIDIALFYSENSDMIEYLFGIYPVAGEDFSSFGFMASNVEQSRVYGTEIEFALSAPAGQFTNSLTGGYVFMYPVEFNPDSGKDTGTYLKYRRKHSAKINFTTRFRRFEMGISMQAASPVLNIDKVFLSELTRETILPGFYDYWNNSDRGYFLVDPHFGYSLSDRIKISFAVKNAFNTEYMGRPGDIMPHRNFSLRLTGSF